MTTWQAHPTPLPPHRPFFFNTVTEELSWNHPASLTHAIPLAARRVGEWWVVLTTKRQWFWYHPDHGAMWTRPEPAKRSADVANDEEEGAPKRVRVDDEPEDEQEMEYEFDEDDVAFQLQAMEEQDDDATADVDAAETLSPEDQRALAVADFEGLLAEVEVNAFSVYDLVKSKISRDPRYRAIADDKDRRELFEAFCAKQTGNQAAKKTVKTSEEKFEELMREYVTLKTTYDQFRIAARRDARSKLFDPRTRQKLFKDFIKTLRSEKEQQEKNFLSLLAELSQLRSDTRYRDIQKEISSDTRYKAVESSSKREQLFYDYRDHLRHKKPEKDRSQREADAIRERERQMQHEVRQRGSEANRSRQMLMHEQATMVFNTLLIDTVRKHQITWSSAEPLLMADGRWKETGNALSMADKKELFDGHMATLQAKAIKAFEDLLNATFPTLPSFSISLDQVLPVVGTDARFKALLLHPHKDSLDDNDGAYMEKRLASYLRARAEKIKSEFNDLMQERRRLLEYRYISAEATQKSDDAEPNDQEQEEADDDEDAVRPKRAERFVTIEEAHELLKDDARYIAMAALPDVRVDMMESWMRTTESTYRSKKYTLLPSMHQ